jgi:tetratricopeptide (TPR) repeat protein
MKALALILLLSALLYFNSFNNSFHFDDYPAIVENPYIRNLEDIPALLKGIQSSMGRFRTLPALSFAVNYHFNGLDVFGYHLLNLIYHILSGILVYLISKNLMRLDGGRPEEASLFSILCALLFISHPLQVNTVTYIVQRTEGFLGFFYLLSLFLFMKGSFSRGWKRVLLLSGSGLSIICSSFSKEVGFTAPLVLILFDLLFLCKNRGDLRKRFIVYLPGLLILYAFFLFKGGLLSHLTSESRGWFWTPWENLLTQSNVIVHYIRLLLLPLPGWLNVDHDIPISKTLFEYPTFASFGALLLLLALATFMIKRGKTISFAILFFFIVLAPTSSFIPLWDVMMEYRLHLPVFAYSLVLSSGFLSLYRVLSRRLSGEMARGIVLGISILLLCFYSLVTIERNRVFRDEVTLWADAAKKSPNKMRVHHNLGRAYFEKGRVDEAIREGEMALTLSHHLYSRDGLKFVFNLLGSAYFTKGEWDKALSLFQQSLAIDPNFPPSHYNLSCLHAVKGEKEPAGRHLKMAIRLNPDYKEKASAEQIFAPFRNEKEFKELME